MWVVFLLISTAPGILMLAILCALLRGISHDVFADDPMDEYADLTTGPTYQRRPVSWADGEGGHIAAFTPPLGLTDYTPQPPDATLIIRASGPTELLGAPPPFRIPDPPL